MGRYHQIPCRDTGCRHSHGVGIVYSYIEPEQFLHHSVLRILTDSGRWSIWILMHQKHPSLKQEFKSTYTNYTIYTPSLSQESHFIVRKAIHSQKRGACPVHAISALHPLNNKKETILRWMPRHEARTAYTDAAGLHGFLCDTVPGDSIQAVCVSGGSPGAPMRSGCTEELRNSV